MVRTAEAIPLNTGHLVSGGAHALLIGWVFLGGVFVSDPEPFEITGVDVISVADFEALFTPENVPKPTTSVETPVTPVVEEVAPELRSAPDPEIASVVTPEPEPVVPDTPPEVTQPVPLVPPTPVVPTPPEAPVIEPPATALEQDQRPVARPVRRVAPTPVQAPEPDVQIAEIDQAPTAPSDTAEIIEEAQEATQQEEAATEILTEPQDREAAPQTSLRPVMRPRAVAQPVPAQPSETAAVENDSLTAALSEALAESVSRPSGPPLTQGERDALRVAVQQCWIVDVGSQAANVTVTLGMTLDRDGRVQGGSLRLLDAQGGDDNAARAAFDAARRAVLRCQRGGYKLPIEKYDHWREIEMTFNPEKMRRR